MATANPSKRPAEGSPDEPATKKPKKQATNKQVCVVCEEENAPDQYKKFDTCPPTPRKKKCNKTCNFCWTKYVKINSIQNPRAVVECTECNTALSRDQIRKLFGTGQDVKHYDFRLRSLDASENGERECSRAGCKGIQAHSRDGDGRVFTCSTCGFQDCVDCNVPEHGNETCEGFRARMDIDHEKEEAATTAALADGYKGMEKYGKYDKQGLKDKKPVQCPGCSIPIERETKCPRVRCVACNMEFCTRPGCGAMYLGVGSVLEKGNAAHAETCKHFHREREDKRFKKATKGSDVKVKEGEEVDEGDSDEISVSKAEIEGEDEITEDDE